MEGSLKTKADSNYQGRNKGLIESTSAVRWSGISTVPITPVWPCESI